VENGPVLLTVVPGTKLCMQFLHATSPSARLFMNLEVLANATRPSGPTKLKMRSMSSNGSSDRRSSELM
jgi:hypothetical protein